MNSISVQHSLPPDRLRLAVLGRRIKLPDATASVVAELAFGIVHREQADALPVSAGRARS